MNKLLLYLPIAFLLLLALSMAGPSGRAAAADDARPAPKTDKEKVQRIYELLDQTGTKPDVIALIADVGARKFLEPVIDDETALVETLKKLAKGANAAKDSVVEVDVYTYLLKDKRTAVLDHVVPEVKRLAIYADKPIVSERLFDLYKNAGDDADLRAVIAPSLMATSMPDPEHKEMRPYGPDDYKKGLERAAALMKDSDWRVRFTAVDMLPKNINAIHDTGLGVLEHDRDGRVRAAVIDIYRETRIKTKPARELALRGLQGPQIEELTSAVAYCSSMKMAEAREPMYDWLRAKAGPLDENDPITFRTRLLKRRIIDTTITLGWKDAIDPDLFWLVDNDADWRASGHAAYAVLRLYGGSRSFRMLGGTDQTFPSDMVQAEYEPMIAMFGAWRKRVYEGQGASPEVLEIENNARISFAQNTYAIAEQRLLDNDTINKERGLDLVMVIGPDDFAKAKGTIQKLTKIYAALETFPTKLGEKVETNRKIARLVFGFLSVNDVNVKKLALKYLHSLAPFCDRDQARRTIPPIMGQTSDDELRQMCLTVMDTIAQRGFSAAAEEAKEQHRYHEDDSEDE